MSFPTSFFKIFTNEADNCGYCSDVNRIVIFVQKQAYWNYLAHENESIFSTSTSIIKVKEKNLNHI